MYYTLQDLPLEGDPFVQMFCSPCTPSLSPSNLLLEPYTDLLPGCSGQSSPPPQPHQQAPSLVQQAPPEMYPPQAPCDSQFLQNRYDHPECGYGAYPPAPMPGENAHFSSAVPYHQAPQSVYEYDMWREPCAPDK